MRQVNQAQNTLHCQNPITYLRVTCSLLCCFAPHSQVPIARYPQRAAHSWVLTAAPAAKDRPAKLNQQHSLADVLSSEDDPARLALEAADVPLLLQCQEGLALLDLLLASCAVWSRGAKRRGNG